MLNRKLAVVLILLPTSFNLIAKAQRQHPWDSANTASLQNDFSSPPESNRFHYAESVNLTGESSSTEGYIRIVPAPKVIRQPASQRPFRTVAFGIKANTLGVGAEFATPLAQRFNLRSGVNFLTFGDPFNVDGVSYDAHFHLKSSQTTLDWFPTGGSFHVSPGVLYMRNTASASASVPEGQSFSLGDQTYVNSMNDPVTGSMSYAYPHNLCPLMMLGFGNVLPRNSRHFSLPVEFGVAYTGAATINVGLIGTACSSQGCGNFANDLESQASLKQEVHTLNEDLKRIPVYPILSLGVAYHF
jgi:hypothetical protein